MHYPEIQVHSDLYEMSDHWDCTMLNGKLDEAQFAIQAAFLRCLLGICPSKWLKGEYQGSEIWADKSIHTIPNTIDSVNFDRGDQKAALNCSVLKRINR